MLERWVENLFIERSTDDPFLQVLEQPDSLTSEKLYVLDNLLSVTGIPQNHVDLCRWLLSFQKVLPRPGDKSRGTPGATKTDTPKTGKS